MISYQSTFCPLDWMSFTGHCHATSPLTGTGVINKLLTNNSQLTYPLRALLIIEVDTNTPLEPVDDIH